MISDERLERWEAQAKAATPGDWYVVDQWIGRVSMRMHGISSKQGDGDSEWVIDQMGCVQPENKEFICASREAVPLLIAEVRRLRDALENIANGLMHGDEAAFRAGKALDQ